ncbi:MAG: hypothetical protein WBD09_02380 [Halobacteriota archaeon]
MKKIIIPLLVLILITSVVSAAGSSGINESGTGIENSKLNETGQGQQVQVQVEQETQNEGENITVRVRQRERLRARNVTELKQMRQERQREMNQTIQGLGKNRQTVYQNQNRVRLAVHSLLAMEDLVGGIGPQVSQIAREFNNSVQATIRAEERIQNRSRFVRFFAGGDEKAAEEMEQEVNQSQQRIQQLKQLRVQCDCGEEVKAMMHEQMQIMEQEQARLLQLAQNEKNKKGLFGWLWK